jgi:hypothetical protein
MTELQLLYFHRPSQLLDLLLHLRADMLQTLRMTSHYTTEDAVAPSITTSHCFPSIRFIWLTLTLTKMHAMRPLWCLFSNCEQITLTLLNDSWEESRMRQVAPVPDLNESWVGDLNSSLGPTGKSVPLPRLHRISCKFVTADRVFTNLELTRLALSDFLALRSRAGALSLEISKFVEGPGIRWGDRSDDRVLEFHASIPSPCQDSQDCK